MYFHQKIYLIVVIAHKKPMTFTLGYCEYIITPCACASSRYSIAEYLLFMRFKFSLSISFSMLNSYPFPKRVSYEFVILLKSEYRISYRFHICFKTVSYPDKYTFIQDSVYVLCIPVLFAYSAPHTPNNADIILFSMTKLHWINSVSTET